MKTNFADTHQGGMIAPALLQQHRPGCIRWTGSKNTQMDDLSLLMPRQIKRYVEPFLGGGNVVTYLLMEGRLTGDIILSDRSPLLINYYHVLQREPERLAGSILALQERFGRGNRDLYGEAVSILTSQTAGSLKKAVALFVRNALVHALACSELEERIGDGFSPTRAERQGLTATKARRLVSMGRLLEKAEIRCCDYRETLERDCCQDAFVFLDPPYFEPGERLYGVAFDFQEFSDTCQKVANDNQIMVTIDAGETMMRLLSPFRQFLRPTYYPSTGKTDIEQVALNYKPKMMDEKLRLLEWTEVERTAG